jgi:hypothetical protein
MHKMALRGHGGHDRVEVIVLVPNAPRHAHTGVKDDLRVILPTIEHTHCNNSLIRSVKRLVFDSHGDREIPRSNIPGAVVLRILQGHWI